MKNKLKIARVVHFKSASQELIQKSWFLKKRTVKLQNSISCLHVCFRSLHQVTRENILFQWLMTLVSSFFRKRNHRGGASYLVEMFQGEHNLSGVDLHLGLRETLSLRKMSKKFSTIYII